MHFRLTLFLCFLLSLPLLAQQAIERVEPPFWWTGMHNPELQLLVYGKAIGYLDPQVEGEGVTLKQTIKVANPNYLFLDLHIDEDAPSGKLQIHFHREGTRVLTHTYELKSRREGSAERKGFDNSDVLYLITPDRFANGDPSNDYVEGMQEKPNRKDVDGRHGGDIAGIDQHLEYLRDLGFSAIWLNPLLENDQPRYSYHGYATTDFYAVDARFGSNEDYVALSQKARAMGIGMIMDMIVNHCGHQHWWIKDLPTPDWINFNNTFVQTNHTKFATQDPYASTWDKRLFFDGWFDTNMPDMNQRQPLLANYLIQNSIWWVEYADLYGIRMDTYPYPDMHFMTEWTRRVMAEYPNFNIVGEEWNGDPAIVSYWQRGKVNSNGYTSELPSLMDFPLQEQVRDALQSDAPNAVRKIYEMIARDFLYPDPMNLVVFPDNHDMDRFFTQVNFDYARFKMGLIYHLTTRGIPQLYYGTEILMANPPGTGHGVIRSDFPGGWEGDTKNARTGEGLGAAEKEALEFVRKLLQWRKNEPLIHTGKLMHFLPENNCYVYFRYNDTDKIMVIFNRANQTQQLDLTRFQEMLAGSRTATDALSGQSFDLDQQRIAVPGMTALVLTVGY